MALYAGADCVVRLGGEAVWIPPRPCQYFSQIPGQPEYIQAKPIYVDTKVPVILVPTTAGTGSEQGCHNIHSELNAKWSVFVNINLAIVDPAAISLPKQETANTGLDAFAHAAEAMTCKNWNHHSNILGEAAIRRIAKILSPVTMNGQSEARTEMALAANLAGLAFNDPITHVGHAIADALSCAFPPHGLGCALALPETMACRPRYAGACESLQVQWDYT